MYVNGIMVFSSKLNILTSFVMAKVNNILLFLLGIHTVALQNLCEPYETKQGKYPGKR